MFNSCSNCKIKKKINLIPLSGSNACSNVAVAVKKMHPVLQSYKVCDKNYKRAIKLKQYSTPVGVGMGNKSGGNVVLSYSNSNSNNNEHKVHHRRIKSNQICINIKVNNNSVKYLNCVSGNYYNFNGVNRRCNYNYKCKYKNAFSQDHLPVINNKHTILTQGSSNNNNCKHNYSRNNNNIEKHKRFEIENSFISEIQSIIDDSNNTHTNNNGLHIIYSKKRDIINTNRPTTSYAHIKLKNNLRTKSLLSPN